MICVELSYRGFSVLQVLADKASALLEIRLRFSERDNSLRIRDVSLTSFSVSTNVYGPRCSTASVGSFLQKCELYLQIPDRCGFDVPYMNPHCLTTAGEKEVMTSVFDSGVSGSPQHEESENGGLFDELGDEEQFEEELQPALVKTPLHRYSPTSTWVFQDIDRAIIVTRSRHCHFCLVESGVGVLKDLAAMCGGHTSIGLDGPGILTRIKLLM